MEPVDQTSGLVQHGHIGLNGCDPKVVGLAQMIAASGHQLSDSSGGRHSLKLLTGYLRTAAPGRPFANDTL
jgi:hypothetical protein